MMWEGKRKKGGGFLQKKKKCYLNLCMATLLVLKEELIVPRKKKTPVWSSNDCECTWYVRQRNTAQCYDHFPACTCDWSSLMELSDKGALLC